MKKLFALILLIGHSFISHSQDLVFTQTLLTPLNITPATAGLSGTDQLAINYRLQSKYSGIVGKSLSLNYDRPFQLRKGIVLGVGLRYLKEEDRYRLKNFNWNSQQYSIAAAIHIPIIKKENSTRKIIVGLERGKTMLDWAINTQNSNFGGMEESLDFSGGITFRADYKSQQHFDIGLAILRMNSYYSDARSSAFFPIRESFYMSGQIYLKENWWLNPKFAFSRNDDHDLMIFGSGIKYIVGKHQIETHVGFRYSFSQEIFGFFGPRYFYKNQVGFSATIEIGKIIDSQYGSSFEGTILYRFQKKKKVLPY